MPDVSHRVAMLVVGTGPAGLSASMQARRDMLEHLVVGDEQCGGLLGAAWRIDNLAGYPGGVTGQALARKLAAQADDLRLPVIQDRVMDASRKSGVFVSTLESGKLVESQTLVLATGSRPRRWSATGAEVLREGGRLHRDVRSLPERLDDHRVIVIGGGDAALDSALSVHRRGGQAIVLARGDVSRANPRILERVEVRGIEVRTSTPVTEVRLEGLTVVIPSADLEASHLVVCIGRVADDRLYRQLVADGQLPDGVETPVEGLFVAGDLAAGRNRYVASAFGQGQQASLAAARVVTER
jgi:thioredoxin reductase (NADPH)